MPDLATRLAERTLELVNIPSESRHEAEIAAHVRSLVPPSFEVEYEAEDAFVWARPRREGKPLVVLAGHYDTVPAQENVPGPDRERRRRRARRERHEGRPRGHARAGAGARRHGAGRRPRPARVREGGAAGRVQPSAAPVRQLPRRARGGARDPARADRLHDPGRLPRQPERADHLPRRQRPLGAAVDGGERDREGARGPAPVRRDRAAAGRDRRAHLHRGRERHADRGRDRDERDPRPRRGERQLPLRARPLARRARRRTCAACFPEGATFEHAGDSPPARVVTDSPLVQRLRAAGDLGLEPKQAWTNVADFTSRGIDAVNFGPGATRYAHRRDEQVEIAALERAFTSLWRFVTGTV